MKYLVFICLSGLLFVLFSCGSLDQLPNGAPSITSASFSIDENSAVGTIVGTLSATDANSDPITFSLPDASNMFIINANSGKITVAGAIDFETTSSTTFVVAVTDSKSIPVTASVTITIINVNEAPSISDVSFTVTENVGNGSIVGTLTATDPDDSDTHTFTITSGNEAGHFEISNAGELTTSAALDYETTTSYSLSVTLTDAGGLTDTDIILIEVTNTFNFDAFSTDAVQFYEVELTDEEELTLIPFKVENFTMGFIDEIGIAPITGTLYGLRNEEGTSYLFSLSIVTDDHIYMLSYDITDNIHEQNSYEGAILLGLPIPLPLIPGEIENTLGLPYPDDYKFSLSYEIDPDTQDDLLVYTVESDLAEFVWKYNQNFDLVYFGTGAPSVAVFKRK